MLLGIIRHFHRDPQRALKVALHNVGEVYVDSLVELYAPILGIVLDEGLRREGKRNDRLFSGVQCVDCLLRRRLCLDGKKHLVDDVVHDRRKLRRVCSHVAKGIVHCHASGIVLEPVLGPFLAPVT